MEKGIFRFLEENKLESRKYKYDFDYVVLENTICNFTINDEVQTYESGIYTFYIYKEFEGLNYYYVSVFEFDEQYSDYYINEDTYLKLLKMFFTKGVENNIEKLYNTNYRKVLIIRSNDYGTEYFNLIKFKNEVKFCEVQKIIDKYNGDYSRYSEMLCEINNKYPIEEMFSSGYFEDLYFN